MYTDGHFCDLAKIFQQKQKGKIKEDEIIDLFWDCLQVVYSLTIKALRQYDVSRVEPIQLAKLTWDERLEDRIRANIENWRGVTNLLLNEIEAVMNRLIYAVLKENDSLYAEIIAGDQCTKCVEASSEVVSIRELKKLPPFHPYCGCRVIYYESVV